MTAPQLKDYPFKAKTDSRSAMARTLAQYMSRLTFRLPRSGRPFRFQRVYQEWAGWESHATVGGRGAPVAAVLPDRPIPDDPAFNPRVIEETWSGGDPTEFRESGKQRFPIGDGSGDGFVLVEVNQRKAIFLVIFRCATKTQRRAVFRSIEEAFVEDGLLTDPASLDPAVALQEGVPDPPVPTPQIPYIDVQPVRTGRVLEVDGYFNRKCSYTIESGPEPLDTDQFAHENRWVGQVEISALMQICAVRRCRGMDVRIQMVADGYPVSRGEVPTV